MIPIELCLGGRQLTEPRPSPDGRWVAFVSRTPEAATLVLVGPDGGGERVVTTDPAPAPGRGFGGGCLAWLPDSSAVVYAAGDGNLWLRTLDGDDCRRVTDVGDGRAVEAPMVSAGGDVVVAVVDQAEVWSWALDGSAPPRRLDDGSADFVFDPFLSAGGTVAWQAWNVPDMAWDRSRIQRTPLHGGLVEQLTGTGAIQQIGELPDATPISVRDDSGWLNVWVGGVPLVDEPFEHAGPTWGMRQRTYAVSPDGWRVAFTRNERGFGRLCVVDVGSGEVTQVGRGVHGQLGWVGDRLTALRSGARTPTQVVAYDTDEWTRTVLAVGPDPQWADHDLPEPELVEVEHDGVVLHARRFVAGQGRTLCWVHGGPTDQWQVEFMPRIAYWWSRGWDVLVPDPRGSTGHGRAYQQALRGQWGQLDVADVAAILAGSHGRRWSTPERTVVIGSSSGGMAALGVLGRHPGLAAGGVVLYPVTDLEGLAAASHRFEAHYTSSLVGPLGDVDTYRARSPISYADRIDVPLLVMHGDADPVVPLASTVEFVDRLRASGGEVELVVMAGEGHGFRDPVNVRADYELTEAFLRRHVPSS